MLSKLTIASLSASVTASLSAGLAASVAAGLLATVASAESFEVQMLNRGVEGAMVFEPAFVMAAVGDTIIFLSTDRGHNVEGIEGMLPEGVAPFTSEMGEDYSLTVTTEGLYGIKCTPHYAMGMVGLIQVGGPVNLEAAMAVTHRGKAKTRFEALFTQVIP